MSAGSLTVEQAEWLIDRMLDAREAMEYAQAREELVERLVTGDLAVRVLSETGWDGVLRPAYRPPERSPMAPPEVW